jgi:hypothetical protein
VEERRRYKRSSVDLDSDEMLRVDFGGDQEPAKVLNYSNSGLSLLTGKALPMNRELIISFDLSEQKNVSLTGKVVWVTLKDKSWHIGVNLNTTNRT